MSANSSVVLSVLLGSLMISFVIGLIWLVLNVIATWRIFTKAGEQGWKSLIPFYNQYVLYRLTWNTQIFWIWLILTIAASVLFQLESLMWLGTICNLAVFIISLTGFYKLSRAFGHGAGFAAGLFFLNPIFMMILGFNSDQYRGPQ